MAQIFASITDYIFYIRFLRSWTVHYLPQFLESILQMLCCASKTNGTPTDIFLQGLGHVVAAAEHEIRSYLPQVVYRKEAVLRTAFYFLNFLCLFTIGRWHAFAL